MNDHDEQDEDADPAHILPVIFYLGLAMAASLVVAGLAAGYVVVSWIFGG